MNNNAEKRLSLKELALNIKENITSGKDLNVESYVENLSKISDVGIDDIRNIYNIMFMIVSNHSNVDSKKVHWTKEEDSLILEYIRISKSIKERVSMRDNLLNLSEILINRTESSVIFRYYNALTDTAKNKKKNVKINKRTKSNTKADVKRDINHNPVKNLEAQSQENNGDLLNIMVEFIDNIEIADIDIQSLFNSLLILSRKAVKNADKEELELLKKEKVELKEEIKNLTKDLHLLKKEFENFSRMDGKEKIRNIQNLTDRVNYIVDGYGNVSVKE